MQRTGLGYSAKKKSTTAPSTKLRHAVQFVPSSAHAFDRPKFEQAILHTRNSAPGPDGNPYAALRVCAHFISHVFEFLWHDLVERGGKLHNIPPDLNHSFLYCLLKDDGSTIGDDGAITPAVSYTHLTLPTIYSV